MAAKFCNTCIFWEKDIFTRQGEHFGVCHEVAVASKIEMDGSTNLREQGTFYTEGYFGCIYWRENHGTLLNFEDIIDNKTGELK